MLGEDHHHDEPEADHHHHADHNQKAAYLHVLADALTSVLAIVALLAGHAFGWSRMDAAMAISGGIVISQWVIDLLRETSHILLDGRASESLVAQIRSRLEGDADTRICDLHT